MQPGAIQVLKLSIPGFTGVPRLQVLPKPSRVVVDLPGVNRGDKVSRKDLLGLTCPQILRSRLAQFATAPQPVTRIVLEVVPGTQATVTSDGTGVSIALDAGQGAVRAQMGTQVAPAPAVPAPPMESETVASSLAALPQTPVLPERAAMTPVPQPGLPTAAPAPVERAPYVVKEETPAQPAAPIVIKEEAPKVAAKAEPLAPVPAIGAPFQALPSLAVQSVLPTALGQEKAAPHREQSRSGRTLGDTTGRYTGARMTIDVVGTDLTSFLRIIADTAHLNLIVDQDVQGIYTFKFTDTPWDQVLDVILKHAGLGKEVSNGIIRVAKIEKLQKEEEDRKRLDDAKSLAGDVQSITRPLSFAKAVESKAILDKMLTKRGSIIVDDRTNTLIITDLPRNLPLLDDLIAQLDVQIQQVQIEARVVEASKNWEKDFGVKWPTTNTGNAAITNSAGTAAPWGSTNGTSWNSINNLATTGNAATVAFAPGATGVTDISSPAGEFWVSFLSNRMSVNVILQALEKQGVVKIVSSPKVVTQNNKKAKVLSGAKIPYPAQQAGNANGAIAVQFADANLELEVTPQITNDGTILMDVKVEKADADFGQLVGTTPTITRKAVETQVLVKDGGTAIMGGVYKNNNTQQSTGVPFLKDLPLIGFLFRNKINKDSNDELLIFITPRILKN
ncbi:type IV pilus secretin PilQ [Mesoterricola silvestris]|nr:type IV pilus secretin PilQ [Mesoterricola silvestris]